MPNPILDKITIDDIEYDLVGNGGGHVIEKSDGTDMTQRSNLQFVDAQLTDDSTNDRTKIENVKIIQNESELANLPDGIYMGAQDEAIPFSFEAEDISYDNTTSQLEATNVQAAIDELSQKEAGVQSDWNEADDTKLDYIKNKPANLIQDANYIHTDNNYTSTEKTKLGTIAEGAEVNVQSDWSQTDNTADDYIKNKPTIPDAQIQSDWNQTSGTAKDFIKNKPTLGTASALDVATSGDASSTQVVKGDDSRLTDARTPVSHTHTLSEITDAGSAASKDSTSSVTAGSTDLVESGAVKTAIDNAISGAYKHAGTKTCAELISSLLIASNNGNVYNITDSGTTTVDFIEGAGIPIRAGDNVGIAKISDSIYKFDLLSGFIDTSNFVTKSSTSGLIKNDGSIDTTEYAPASSVPAAQIQSDWSQSDNTKLDYIKNKPTLGSAAAKNVPSSGDAGNSEVVLGNDSRLTDARNAADVYSWAKAENKPSYTKSEIGLGNVDNTSDATKKSNFTGSIASANTGFVTGGDAYTELAKKVDKVDGKGLSTNDYTTTEKDKLAGIASGAEVNVQSDWNQSDNTKDDFIKNKPANLVQDASYVHTDNNYTSDEKTKLSGIAAGAEVNVQTDWDETDDTQDDYIKNKPEAYDAIWQNNDILEGVSDVQPYLYRATNKPDGAIEYVQEKLIGASAAVNQLTVNGNFANTENWNGTRCSLSASGNVCTATVTDASSWQAIVQNIGYNLPIVGHKVLVYFDMKASNTNVNIGGSLSKSTLSINTFVNVIHPSTFWARYNYIITISANVEGIRFVVAGSPYFTVNDTWSFKNVNCIDLTQMFGTAIADLAYSKEQASAGSGIAWLKSYGFFTKDYYPYNTGALQSIKTEVKKITGKNLLPLTVDGIKAANPSPVVWIGNSCVINGITFTILTDDDNNVIGIKGNGTCTADWTRLNFDEFTLKAGNYILNGVSGGSQSSYRLSLRINNGENEFVTYDGDVSLNIESDKPISQARYIVRVRGAVLNNVIIYPMLRLSTESDSTFEPYTSTTYPLDSDLELRGLYKLDASNNIVCDGDEYTSDGNVKRKYGIVNLGGSNISWTYASQYGIMWTDLPNSPAPSDTGSENIICPKYMNYIGSFDDFRNNDKVLTWNNKTFSSASGRLVIKDSAYTDATAFKTAMSGVYLIYELATSTTDSAASYQNPQIIHENGTEEFIDTRDYSLPVGHNTSYFTASDEKFFLPPVVDNDGRFLYHDGDGFQFKNFNQVASKVEESDINGNIKIDGTETQVYDDSEIKGELTTDTTTIEGNPLNFTTLSAQTAKSTILSVEPIQDLHGYDKPWVGGAGKNKLPMTVDGIKAINTDGTWSGNTYSFRGNNYKILTDSDNNVIGINVNSTSTVTRGWLYLATNVDYGNSDVTFSSSPTVGNYTFTSGNSNDNTSTRFVYYNSGAHSVYLLISDGTTINNENWYPMVRLSTETDATFQPYTNIASISGRSEIGILGCGKNLIDFSSNNVGWATNYDSIVTVLNTLENGTYTFNIPLTLTSITGTISEANYQIRIDTELGANYVNQIRSWGSSAVVGTTKALTVSIVVNDSVRGKFTKCYLYACGKAGVGAYGTAKATNVQLELGSRATDYSPYTKSNDLTISLGQTVYGGTIDVENGLLIIDGTCKEYSVTQAMTSIETKGTCTRFWLDGYTTINSDKRLDIISNVAPYSDNRSSSMDSKSFVSVSPNYVNSLCWQLPTALVGTTEQTIKAYLADNPVNAYTPLAEPITIQLTPHQISLLEGVNNISTDGDKITLTYRDGSVATLGDLTSAVDNLDSKIDQSKILTDTATGDKYILVVTNGVLSVEQISN